MQKFKIDVCVPREVAVGAAVAEYGSASVEVTGAQLEELSADERRWIQLYTSPVATSGRNVDAYLPDARPEAGYSWGAYGEVSRGPLVLDEPTPTWGAIVAALGRDAAKAQAVALRDASDAREERDRRRARMERESALARAWIDADDADVVTQDGVREYRDKEGRWVASGFSGGSCVDLRCVPEDLAGEYRARRAARQAQVDAARAAEVARRQVEAQEYDAAIRAYATTLPDLARSAAEGYDVADAVVGTVATLLGDALGSKGISHVVLTEGSRAWDRYSFSARRAPRARAHDVRDAVLEVVAALAVPDEVIDVTVDRIERVTVAPHDRDADEDNETYTGVTVMVELFTPRKDVRARMVVVRAE